MHSEHFQSQVYLWFFILRSLTRLAYQPPLEEENAFLPLIHHNTLIALRLREVAKRRCVEMLASLLQDYDWDVLVYARPLLRFLN